MLDDIRKLTSPAGLMEQTIDNVKSSNGLARKNECRVEKALRLLLWCLAGIGALILVGGVTTWLLVLRLDTISSRSSATSRALNDMTRRLSTAEQRIQNVQVNTEEIKKDQNTQTQIEVIPEQDPRKAIKSPLKIRVIPPKELPEGGSKNARTAAMKPPSAVEIPITVSSARTVPAPPNPSNN